MDTDVHGLRTGYVDERLHLIGERFIVFPSVFIRVHPWFLQAQSAGFRINVHSCRQIVAEKSWARSSVEQLEEVATAGDSQIPDAAG